MIVRNENQALCVAVEMERRAIGLSHIHISEPTRPY